MTRTGARILVDQLVVHGVDTVFCVPGESYIGALDALRDAPIRLVVARHEAGAANMAEAYGKLTGRPGICFVTRAPGATHAATGVYTAFQDSTPLILFVGQVPRGHRGREAFQELDYAAAFGSYSKWVDEVEQPGSFPETMAHAFQTALSGRPGPVVVALPEDVLDARAEVSDAAPRVPVQAAPSAADLALLRELLGAAERPLVVVGGGGWSAQAAADLQAFAEANGLPVTTSFRRQNYVDNASPSYAGVLTIGHDPALASRLRDADLLLVVGARLGDIPTRGYTTLEPPRTPQTLVHIHADADELGRVFEPDLPIVSGSPEFLAAARALDPVEPLALFLDLLLAHALDGEHAVLDGDLDVLFVDLRDLRSHELRGPTDRRRGAPAVPRREATHRCLTAGGLPDRRTLPESAPSRHVGHRPGLGRVVEPAVTARSRWPRGRARRVVCPLSTSTLPVCQRPPRSGGGSFGSDA